MLSFCSSFLNDIGYFGCYPNEEQFQELLANDFIYFIDLTTLKDRNNLKFNYSLEIPKYKNIIYINFSIIDNYIPHSQKLFQEFVYILQNIIEKKKKVYIHCKGGHGRSPMIVASLLCSLYFYPPQKALSLTKNYYENRVNLKEKYKGIQCPQIYCQRKFILDMYSKNKL